MNSYYQLCTKNNDLFAEQILFESNALANKKEVDSIIEKFITYGYELITTGENTILKRKDYYEFK